ncbi:capsular polysaccharide biosynthesis protein [Melghirimyces profundicolus]|uniref:Capsular polysaccharide biosynthesis protein n=1 Tax=Melghirimyces profundicolus TaxID=1242148 RepID=A0A2T6B235_9BACL|nr:glycosyltransferase family 61 protein [Melghirimyces profundicolus]PTX50129.1 capsular polysaccharide biosynthesis protein [Melghirimyces profundicolus]
MLPIPKGYKKHFLEWLDSSSPNSKDYYQKIYDQEYIHCRKPIGCHSTPSSNFLKKHVSPEGFISIIPKGRVWGKDGAIITPDHLVIAEFSHQSPHYLRIEKHPIFQQSSLSGPRRVNGNVAVITSVFNSNYYHWVFDVIARIHLLQKSQIKIDQYIINGCKHRFQIEWLKLAGIPLNKVMIAHKDLHMEATNLIVPSYDQPVGHAAPWAIRYLMSLKDKICISDNNPNSFPKRIYLDRSHKPYRKVSNNQEVKRYLTGLGYKVMYPERFSIKQQIEFFSNIEAIVAPSGAALTNLLFCKPKTKLLLFQPKGLEDVSYYIICNVLNVDYYLIEGTPTGNRAVLNQADMHINMSKLKNLLKLMG